VDAVVRRPLLGVGHVHFVVFHICDILRIAWSGTRQKATVAAAPGPRLGVWGRETYRHHEAAPSVGAGRSVNSNIWR